MNTQNETNVVDVDSAESMLEYAQQIAYLDRSILQAQEDKSLLEEAQANHRAAQFFLVWCKPKIAAVYLQDAYACYAKLGDRANLQDLENRYPQLLQPVLHRQTCSEPNYFTDEFIATISHEFRTPLHGILGMSESLLEEVFGVMNAHQLNAASTIERSGWYLLALINNMVDLSQIQAGSLELDITPVSVAELCQSSATFVRHHAIQKQIKLVTDVPDNAGIIVVDVQRMRQVLINLLNHAIDSTPVGGRVKLFVVRQQDETTMDVTSSIQFSVLDSSKEISPAHDAQFAQSTLQQQSRRIGFGLMLVNPIVKLHGGYLNCRSVIGRGSCVNVILPDSCLVEESPIDPDMWTEELAVRSGIIAEEISNKPLILIVEDNDLNSNTISSYLTAKGYRPIVAQDGQAGVDLALQYQPDLILMDIQMPGMDGLEAIYHIRQDSRTTDIPIVALTALAMEGDREQCLAAGANEYISKPVKLKQLHTTIQQFLVAQDQPSCALSDFLI